MKIAAPICALLFLFAYSVRAEDAESKNERDPWNGFGIGSWVIQVKSFTKGTETTTQREKQTRTEAEKGWPDSIIGARRGQNIRCLRWQGVDSVAYSRLRSGARPEIQAVGNEEGGVDDSGARNMLVK